MSEEEEALRLGASIAGLADRAPLVSAKRILTNQQRRWGIMLSSSSSRGASSI